MIIIIDDNKDLNDITCELLNLVGYDTVSALNGEEGIAKAKAQKPKVILCDIGMPRMNGYEVAKLIRQDNELKDVYFIAMSGYSNQTDIERSMEAGFDKYLSKPVSFEVLEKLIDEICT